MANETWIGGADNTGNNAQAATRYYTLGQADAQPYATESEIAVVLKAGELDHLRVYISASGSGDITTVGLRVNGVDTALAVTTPAATTGEFEDNTHSVTVANGDRASIRHTGNSAPYSVSAAGFQSVRYAAAAAPVLPLTVVGNNYVSLNGSTAYYLPPSGYLSAFTAFTEAQAQHKIRGADITLSNLRWVVTSNSQSAATVLRLRKNGANGNLTVSVPAGTTGEFEDTAHSDHLTAGDLVCLLGQGGGSGSIAGIIHMIGTLSGGGGFDVAGRASGLNYSAGSTRYVALGGYLSLETTEALAQGKVPFACAASHLRCSIVQAASGTYWTLTSRINGVDGAQTLTTPTATTGWFEDATHTDTLAAGDHFSVKVINGGAGIGQAVEIAATFTPSYIPPTTVQPGAGSLEAQGYAPGVVHGAAVHPPAGELVVTGYAPLVNAIAVSQAAALVLGGIEVEARAAQQAAMVLAEPPPPQTRASGEALLVIGEVIPGQRVSQQALLVLAESRPCTTYRAQLWKITRRDGVVFTFTSHDEDIVWGDGLTYRACASLQPTASEASSTLGSVGNIELSGIIADDTITEEDLYGGLFDDAFVSVWLVSWGDAADSPVRLAAGWTGNLSQGEAGFQMEVLGPGQRLGQNAIVQEVTPGCRWVFGDSRCGVDREALKLEGVVYASRDRSAFGAELDASTSDLQWENGLVRWTSGRNVGLENEVKTVDFATGEIVLWALASFVPEYGDTFELLPGCDKIKGGGCKVYDNVINFGGFAEVPGMDSILETPDAKV